MVIWWRRKNHRDHDYRFSYAPRTITILGFLIAPDEVIAERVRTVSTKLHIYVFIAVKISAKFYWEFMFKYYVLYGTNLSSIFCQWNHVGYNKLASVIYMYPLQKTKKKTIIKIQTNKQTNKKQHAKKIKSKKKKTVQNCRSDAKIKKNEIGCIGKCFFDI